MEYQHPNTVSSPQGFEVIPVSSRTTFCDGGGGALGHPRVFLKIELGEDSVVCPYCSRTYTYQGGRG